MTLAEITDFCHEFIYEKYPISSRCLRVDEDIFLEAMAICEADVMVSPYVSNIHRNSYYFVAFKGAHYKCNFNNIKNLKDSIN